CHGGTAIKRGILKTAISLGARPATKGEFTRRAFLNGKMSLASCEGLIDMINGESASEVKAGYYLYREKLTETIKNIQSDIKYAVAFIEAGIDYPEEGTIQDNYDEVVAIVNKSLSEIQKIVGRYGKGRLIKSGVNVAILGKPNTGKSSILNALLAYDKAIVSDIAGTTRDIVEGSIDFKSVRFNFSDTAGIRTSDDKIENIGVERAKKIMNSADLCIVVLDGSNGLTKEDESVLEETENLNRIIVANKCDLKKSEIFSDIEVSAFTGENLENLKDMIYDKTIGQDLDLSGDLLTEERHYYALKKAEESLERAKENFTVNTPEIIAFDLKSAWDSLGEVSGETASEDIIEEIFGKFCVGK
ncbi:MAG: tRNA uridine-5-carboxymethylaminomethyl(34) synthesis GTPase MnmE, partial [Clostridia bacterium]|nr:tRNA uridine-5-carboxymethylaminomethyl(34) synthesis GTPase MnmE [Clostridia bacterium]